MLDVIEQSGTLPKRNEFRQKCLAINKDYNVNWIDTEYDLTVAKANSAIQWKDYERRKHLYPNLRYMAIHDNRSRTQHLKYDGLVLPMDHPFWKTHLPPWDYGCRCGVDQTDDEVDTKDIDFDVLLPKNGMGNNPGITGKIIGDDHPYYNVSKKEKAEVLADLAGYNTNRFTPKLLDKYESELNVKIDRSIFGLLQKETPLLLQNPEGFEALGRGAYYHPVANFVKIPIDARRKASTWYSQAVVYHEYGHAIDEQIGLYKSERFLALMGKARKLYTKTEYRSVYNNAKVRFNSIFNRNEKEKYMAFLDTIASLHNSINSAQTHNPKYWKLPNRSEAEFIAHMFENKYAGNNIFEELMPELYKLMVEFNLLDADVF